MRWIDGGWRDEFDANVLRAGFVRANVLWQSSQPSPSHLFVVDVLMVFLIGCLWGTCNDARHGGSSQNSNKNG